MRLDTSSRLIPPDSLPERIRQWRAEGLRVCLASGVFELPHASHARRLAAARSRADRLAVAVLGGASAAAALGDRPPVSAGADRARILAGLRGVDVVALLGDGDAARLEEAARAAGAEESLDSVDRERWSRLRARLA